MVSLLTIFVLLCLWDENIFPVSCRQVQTVPSTIVHLTFVGCCKGKCLPMGGGGGDRDLSFPINRTLDISGIFSGALGQPPGLG